MLIGALLWLISVGVECALLCILWGESLKHPQSTFNSQLAWDESIETSHN